jgi:hypothetical protein
VELLADAEAVVEDARVGQRGVALAVVETLLPEQPK